jgi:hypothetical protein
MGVTLSFRGATVKGESGKFEAWLGKKWDEIADALVQKAMLYGDEEARKCAEDLLKDAKALAPVAQYHFQKLGNSVESAGKVLGKRANVSKASTQVGHDVNIQFRNKAGRFEKAIPAIKTSKGIEPLEKLPGGNLRDSGEVVQVESRRGKKGYAVSFDTRRTDERSRENNFNYAYIQHEDLTFRHKEGQAKFLEQPYLERKAEFIERLGKSQQQAMREVASKK